MRKVASILTVLILIIAVHTALAQNVEYVGSYDTPGIARAVFVSGNYAYVAGIDSALLLVDVSDPSHPTLSATFQTRYSARDVYVSGNYAFVAEGSVYWGYWGALEIVDVSDPAAPDSVGGYYMEYTYLCRYVFVSGGYAYLSYYHTPIEWQYGACEILDISVPPYPTYLSSFGCYSGEGGCDIGDVFVSGDNAYVYSTYPGGSGLLIENISDPEDPFDVGSYMFQFDGIFVAGDYAYLAGYEAGLQIVNVSDPGDPYLAGEFDTPGRARDVFVSGHYAYVADGDSGLQVIDISEPANPVLAGSCDTPGDAWRVYVHGDYAYVADSSSLMILRFNPETEVEEVVDLPRQFSLNQNRPNPFNASTRIDYDIPAESDVEIAVYDILGRRVATLFQGRQQPGHYSFVWDARDVPSGIYFAKLRTASQSEVVRMTLLK